MMRFPRHVFGVMVLIVFTSTSVLALYPERAEATTCAAGAGTLTSDDGCLIFLTSGTSFTVPSDWTSGENTVEVIGAGAGGSGNATFTGGGGGGGGAYSQISNLSLTPGGSVTYAVGAGGGSNTAGGDTYFNGGSCAGASVCAKGGQSTGTASGGSGGASGSGVGTVKYSGGNGATAGDTWSGNAGGGAAGPHGAGNAGGSGDAGYGGAVGGNGFFHVDGAAGGNGTEWDATHGSGGGGGAGYNSSSGGNTGTGGAGGHYGGGGGGGGGSIADCGAASGGAGYQGMVVLKYYPPGLRIKLTVNTTASDGVSVFGTLSKGSGTFVIDDPLDPKNMLLYHSFVESPDVMNVYDGIAKLDGDGEATISLPAYFLPLNKDFRYLGTAIGQPMPNLFLKTEIHKRWFGLFGNPVLTISGGAPGGKVSWQVTGVRHDPFIVDRPIIPEVEKGPDQLVDKGQYLFPEFYSHTGQ